MKQTIEEQIEYLKEMIDEARSEGMQNVANLFAEELQTVLANAKLPTGVLTAGQLRGMLDKGEL